ncbi:hypothetical protein MKX01_000102 [Papaver californicum]|nr:hypothetical protein MKX01_000102 [Papaver californicum]
MNQQVEKTIMMVMNSSNTNNKLEDQIQIYNKIDADDEEVMLPGFRFHPTDEELVGFYLRRKVEKKPLSIEIIKQIDIYKYDPWDLPISPVGDKELYFFCIRERKYKNSVRPNRVTGSGFWKATGIDKPIYSAVASAGASHTNNNNNKHCIGLKKSLVYYRGSAGKGTKTDWMMHEFRLPPSVVVATAVTSSAKLNTTIHHLNSKKISSSASIHDHDAEIWTLCRIFKRTVASYSINNKNKYPPTSHDYHKEIWINGTATNNNISSSTTTKSYSSPQQSFSMESENRSSSSTDQKFNYYTSEEYSTASVRVSSNNNQQGGIINKTRPGGEAITNNNQIHSTERDNSCLFTGELMTDRITHHHHHHQEPPVALQQSNNIISTFQNINSTRSNDIFFLDYGLWDELGSVISSDQALLYGYI